MTNKEIGFKTYTYKHGDGTETIITESLAIDRMESQKMFFINSDNIYFKPPPPPKRWTLKDYWKELKDRIYLAVQCLKHGRDYLD